ncbi:hypothetical protein FDP41_012881 [Naegleria fowleri]|uniref:Beta-1,4-mannosyltransferase n=1 Tax=Naegleria fowleri TaxID=5763 RepID=A0A6A5BSP7_NAEFO|nr:uncharacterized protein FDP41_012881 [Naegleria fowleri]KAF0981093.1 hypothetical protein FDP41_012881 [Naegleria fowleri]CAG4711718.1 unnamed protein product [Naegleria fowleri]
MSKRASKRASESSNNNDIEPRSSSQHMIIKKHFIVFVLGDIGHSPRMQYHSLSIAKMNEMNHHVDFVGLYDSDPHEQVLNQKNLKINRLASQWWNWVNYFMRIHFLFFLLFAPLKVILQFLVMSIQLSCIINRNPFGKEYTPKKILLTQNPPAIPTLFLFWLLQKIHLIKLDEYIIDWHNYGFSILALSRKNKYLIKFAQYLEFSFVRGCATHHLCVSEKLKEDLVKRLKIDPNIVTVMYDRPPEMFGKNLSSNERTELLENVLKIDTSRNFKLIISSTSWTEDEDFSVLLSSIIDLENKLKDLSPPLYLEFVITGKGPQKEYYLKKIASLNLKFCRIQTGYLSYSDYSKLLASSDVGVCLHYSSSKLDLPMKVVDMFGSNLPVCAIEYDALPELVKHGQNGYIFKNKKELTEYLDELLLSPEGSKKLKSMKEHLKQNFQTHRWDDEWSSKVRPLL